MLKILQLKNYVQDLIAARIAKYNSLLQHEKQKNRETGSPEGVSPHNILFVHVKQVMPHIQ